MPDTTSPSAVRPYRSARRAEQARQTRTAVVAAAREVFAERGWAGAGVRDIAARASVSVETVYAAVGRKPALFAAAYDGALVGDDEPVALVERPEFRAVGEGRTLAERAAAAAELIAAINGRTVRLLLALREGAASEPELAERLVSDDANRRLDTGRGLALVLGRPPRRQQTDLLWALAGAEVYDALVNRSGWTAAAYRAWLTKTIIDLNDQE
ncbi:TetR family transcriptional regulator [Frankia canadensis]|uniref:TetR family transcriptional regulator n=1 Tax=Frankia canadensis TaxID=1836972 RepID=A0A2I2KKQ6_9ACTN|nr:TetR/AcrR family transcriptional regulator [Frankia canadensis]SNQ46227.1 TetR family transcriptional regulator [Frankia canadensis]SOU53517.1 TetR family transcriptional regulator [Frankia canadensis]